MREAMDMKMTKRLAACLVLTVAACGAPAEQEPPAAGGPPGSAAGIPDTEIGLSKSSVLEAPAPAAWTADATEPGERPSRPAAFPGSPPVIPHGVADFLPITRDENGCLMCHQPGEKEEGEPTPLPESHLTDLRKEPAVKGEEAVGARVNCVMCHVSLTDAPPLVASEFEK
jgi:nitrate reductase cytochrome c-type subunit